MHVGDVVEDFSALDQSGATVRLTDLLESGPVVLYFYIKAKTPG
jgi:thioredoxin-dependent peroxiredoxin